MTLPVVCFGTHVDPHRALSGSLPADTPTDRPPMVYSAARAQKV